MARVGVTALAGGLAALPAAVALVDAVVFGGSVLTQWAHAALFAGVAALTLYYTGQENARMNKLAG